LKIQLNHSLKAAWFQQSSKLKCDVLVCERSEAFVLMQAAKKQNKTLFKLCFPNSTCNRYAEDADAPLYANFVSSILPMFTATCKSLHELRWGSARWNQVDP
jgi:hypothetical protein